MDAKVYLWRAKVAPDNWFLLVETPDGRSFTAIPVITATAARLKRDGVPEKLS
jgi:hypothetical protein